jgi:hypothetical protein
MPDAMLMMAMRLGFRHCEVRKSVAETGSSIVEKDPGMIKMSNCGALANEFYSLVSLHPQI